MEQPRSIPKHCNGATPKETIAMAWKYTDVLAEAWPADLDSKGLHYHFINLIFKCMTYVSFAVNINAQPFHCFRGTRRYPTRLSVGAVSFHSFVNELSLFYNKPLILIVWKVSNWPL